MFQSTKGPQDTLVLHLYVKELQKTTVHVDFKEQQAVVKFKTMWVLSS